MIKTYSELRRFETFEERFQYLKLGGHVGSSTFGFDRHINQAFYASPEWAHAREQAILRDHGCDLGIDGYEIHSDILIHHITPIVLADILNREPWVYDLENLITTTKRTHNAIHYGSEDPYPAVVTARAPNDTKLW